MSSGGALLPPHCPRSTIRASVCSGLCSGVLIGAGLDQAPGGAHRDHIVHGVTHNPGTASPRTPQWPSVPPSCHTCPFLWPLVTCFKALKTAAGNRSWVDWHCRLHTIPHPSLPSAMGRHGAWGPSQWATNLGTWKFPHRIQHPANPPAPLQPRSLPAGWLIPGSCRFSLHLPGAKVHSRGCASQTGRQTRTSFQAL